MTDGIAETDPRGGRWISPLATGCWALLVLAQLGVLPGSRYAWAFGLWRYLPWWSALLFALASLGLCVRRVRGAVVRLANRTAASVPASPLVTGVLLTLVGGGAWLLRERHSLGDAAIFVVALGTGWQFVFPDIGATFILGLALRVGRLLPITPLDAVRLVSCASGVLTIAVAARCTRHLAPQRSSVLVVLLLFSGGMARIFAGHIEVYAPVIAAVTLYLWRALAWLDGRGTWVGASLALGLAIWLHLSAVFLVPSLLVCCWLAPPDAGRSRAAAVIRALGLAAVPMLGFLIALVAAGRYADLGRAWERALEILGRAPEGPVLIQRWWVRGWGGPPSAGGTDYVFLGRGHLKYLVNALYLLLPAAVPVLVATAVTAGRRILHPPAGVFLATASLSLLVYTGILRAVWGPFDWDLFAITSLVLGMWAVLALTRSVPAPLLSELVVVLVGFQLLFVALPFLVTAVVAVRDAGPFAPGWFDTDLATPGTPPAERLAPWL